MNFAPVFCSIATVMIWSSCFDPVPPIFIVPFAFFTASMYSCGVLYGVFAFTQSKNSSSAIMATGV